MSCLHKQWSFPHIFLRYRAELVTDRDWTDMVVQEVCVIVINHGAFTWQAFRAALHNRTVLQETYLPKDWQLGTVVVWYV